MSVLDPGRSWREASFAFVADEVLNGWREPRSRVEIAIVGPRDVLPFHTLLDAHEPGPPRSHDVCPELEAVTGGRIVVSHGPSAGWPLLAAACPGLHVTADLDSLALARALLPGGHQGLHELMGRLGLRLVDLDAPAAREPRVVRSAVVLANVFERMVDRLLPRATVADLLRLADRRRGLPPPERGLEDGT